METSPTMSFVVILHTLSGRKQETAVDPQDSVSILREYLPEYDGSGVVFLYNMSILVPRHSFAFYNIENGSHVYVLPTEDKKGANIFSISMGTDSTSEKVIGLKNPSIGLEIARICDLQWNRTKMDVATMRNLISETVHRSKTRPSNKIFASKIPIPVRDSKPSEETLPLLWKVSC